ncbi:MAG: hypothetical protein ACTS5I_17125 [Rhodanobacter sp.]
MKVKVGAAALAMSLMTIDQAFAGWFNITPPAPGPAPIPEFDGPGAVAAIALLASVAAIILQKSRAS